MLYQLGLRRGSCRRLPPGRAPRHEQQGVSRSGPSEWTEWTLGSPQQLSPTVLPACQVSPRSHVGPKLPLPFTGHVQLQRYFCFALRRRKFHIVASRCQRLLERSQREAIALFGGGHGLSDQLRNWGASCLPLGRPSARRLLCCLLLSRGFLHRRRGSRLSRSGFRHGDGRNCQRK